jgi:aldehyde:ferredoxin oxidoreductase
MGIGSRSFISSTADRKEITKIEISGGSKMAGGYTGKLLRVDLTTRATSSQEIDSDVLRKYIGGSGLGARFLYDETSAATDPLAPENPLIFLTGPLTGTVVPTSGRHNVVSKSPLTQGWGEAEVGGSWGFKLKGAGYDGVIFQGKADRPVVVVIHDKSVSIEDASDLWGRDTFETDHAMKARFGGNAGVACIGQAGENLVRIASIMTDGEHGRAAGRCGLGAVMGSKHLKAVVTFGATHPVPIRREALQESIKRMMPIIKEKTKALSDYGTAGGILFAEEMGDLPVKNWLLGEWKEGAKKISGQALAASILTGRYSCRSCPIGCGRTVEFTRDGKTIKGGGPELETLGALGSLCLIDDLKAISYGNELCNRFGLDTISAGGVIAFAMEAQEKGLLERDLSQEVNLSWGSVSGMLETIERIARREGIGDLLAEGVRIASQKLGPLTKEFAIEVKGLESSMHDPRAYSSLAVQYATSPHGASHWPGTYLVEGRLTFPDLGYPETVDRFETKGKGVLTARFQDCVSVLNAMRYCRFLMRIPLTVLIEWFNDVTGWEMDLTEFMETGERISNLKRMYNARCGMSRKDDVLPMRWLTQKKGGGTHGFLPHLGEMLNEYYQFRGWGEDGLPRTETLRRLGLEEEISDLPYRWQG